ncbi:DUF2637 domain-containing protein [Antribacter gilvus]|uniref:DUF2637 domain-containing protein n=1 Tax=Antribacter gilvus TaxID=2304675 RepID=UPI000F78533A|nr:DUF2637 domain-containing protein [Antribacter gilvus]
MSRPAARIAADSRSVLAFTVVLTVAVALASFALSFSSLRDAALWGRVPEGIAFLVPVVIDASVLVYGLVALVLRARGRSSAWAWFLMLGFTVVSVGANAAHAYDVGPQLQALVGVVLVALAPLSVLTSTHALASLVVTDEPTPEPAPAVEPVPVVVPEPVASVVVEPVPVVESEPAPVPVAAEPVARRPRLGRLAVSQDTLPGLDVAGVTA